MSAAQSKIDSSLTRKGRGLRSVCLALFGVALNSAALHGAALAQTPDRGGPSDVVSWTASVPAGASLKPGSRTKVTIRGTVSEGWHVYGLTQLPAGPIPLLVTLDASLVAAADGAPTASQPTTFHDPSFNLDTQFYSKPFTVTVPVRIESEVAAGPQQIPLSVRFQSCNGPTCRPPKTVHLTASINVRTGG